MMKPNLFSAFLLALVFISLVGCRPKVDAVMDDALLRRGGEYWERLTINDRPVGFQRTSIANEEIEGRSVKRFERYSRLIVLRHGKRVDMAMKIESLSDSEGDSGGNYLSSRVEIINGNETIEIRSRVQDGKLILENSPPGTEIPWPEKVLGPEAVLTTLLVEPMTVDERRSISLFEPALQRCIETTFVAERIEKIAFQGKTRNLLRIRAENRIEGSGDGQVQTETLWTDAVGNILRRESLLGDGQTLVAVRTDRGEATAFADTNSEASAELGSLGVVPLNRSIPMPEAARLEFFVQMSQGNPADRFPVTPFQDVERLAGKTAKITVWSAVDGEGKTVGNAAFTEKKAEAKPEDLASGRLIDLRNPKLAELAATVDVTTLSPWQTAIAMERLVHDTIQRTDFSVAFASSSEVLQSRSGDCTEYAVLLAALCRFHKIPCRMALGLVYTSFAPSDDPNSAEAGMAFHLWNEVLVDGVWRPLDATLARGGADAARLKIADDSLNGDSPTALAGTVLDVLGRLRINVAE